MAIGSTEALTGFGVSVIHNELLGRRKVALSGNTITTSGDMADGVHVLTNSALTPVLELTVDNNTITSTGADSVGLLISTDVSPGLFDVSVNNNTVAAPNGTGIRIESGDARSHFIRSFADNTVTAAGNGSVVIDRVNFDSGGGSAVSGGSTVIGSMANPIQGTGLVLGSVIGQLDFGTLDVFTDGGTGVQVQTFSNIFGDGFTLTSAAGTINASAAPALFLNSNNTTLFNTDLIFDTVVSTNSTSGVGSSNGTGIAIDGLIGVGAGGNALSIGTLNVSGAAGDGVLLQNSTGSVVIGGGAIDGTTGNAIRSNNIADLTVNNVVIGGNAAIGGFTADLTNSTVNGAGNTAVPFSCNDGGGNTGNILFNAGANQCPL